MEVVLCMLEVLLDNNLKIKKLDPRNQKDIWLAQELDKDETVYGEITKKGYLWSIKNELKSVSFLEQDTIYGCPFSIYKEGDPIGYLHISRKFFEGSLVDLAYAILETERGKGYGTQTLTSISDYILQETEKVQLQIYPRNKPSIKIATKSGFYPIHQPFSKIEETGYITYQKTL